MNSLKLNSKKGFTLLEVVIALAVFAFLIGGLLGFLPWSIEGVSKVKDQDTAYGLVDGVQIEFERMGFSLVEAATNRLDGLYNSFSPPTKADSVSTLLLVARRSGGQVAFEQVIDDLDESANTDPQAEEGVNIPTYTSDAGGVINFNLSSTFNTSDPVPVSLYGFEDSHKENYPSSSRWIPQEDRYFLIKCTQFPYEHRHQHHPSNGFLALQVDIQWPYKVYDPVSENNYRRILPKYRNHFRLPMAIVR